MLSALALLIATSPQTPPSKAPPRPTLMDERPIDAKLFLALRDGQVERVRDLLAKGANPNAIESNGWTPLLWVDGTPAQRLAITKMLVAKGANVKYRQPDQGWTAITSMLNGTADLPILRYLIAKGTPVNTPMEDGMTALHFAARSGDPALVRELVRAGADVAARTFRPKEPTAPDGEGEPPMYRRMRERMRRDSEVEQRDLMERYFEPGFRFTGQTPLFSLVERWSEPVLEEFLRVGADLRVKDDNAWTLLHWSIHLGRLEATEALLKRGLDPNAASAAGFRPLHNAMRVGFGVPHEEAVRLLLAAGADPKAKNAAGQTPLDLLRADTNRNLGELQRDSKDEPRAKETIARYLQISNAIRERLDPSAPPIELPPPLPPAVPRPVDFFTLTAERRVIEEEGRLFLELVFEPPAKAATVEFEEMMLDDYDPITPLPLRVDVAAGSATTVRVEFPKRARPEGAFSIQWSEGRERGQGAEGQGFEPGFSTRSMSGGLGVVAKNPHPDRDLELRLDRVKVRGKEDKTFAGRELSVPAKGEVVIPGLIVPSGGKGTVSLRFHQRLLPNARWIAGRTTVGPSR